MFPNLIFLHWGWVFLASVYMGLRSLGSQKASFSSKDWGEGSTEYLGLLHVRYYQMSCLIQLWTHIFPSLPSAADRPVEALHVAFHISCQIQLQVGFAFVNTILTHSDSIPAPISCVHPFMFELCQSSLFIHTGLLLDSSPAWGRTILEPRESDSWRLNNCPGPLFSPGLSQRMFPSQSLRRPKSALKVVVLSCFALFLLFRILNSTIS